MPSAGLDGQTVIFVVDASITSKDMGGLEAAKPVTGLGSGVEDRAVTGRPTKRLAKEGVGLALGNLLEADTL